MATPNSKDLGSFGSSGDEASELITFTIEPDVFYAAAECPGGTIMDLAAVVKSTDDVDKLDAVMRFFDQILLPDSAELFAARLRSSAKPITFGTAIEVFEKLVEAYTGNVRPTEDRPSSPSGPVGTGRSSTGRARSGGSTRRVPISGGAST